MKDELLKIKEEVKKVIIGKDECIDNLLIAMLCGGHVILEDIPGVGKTTLVLSFAKALNLVFKRVQFTPDLMPTDLTGFTYYHKESDTFKFQKGALLDANIILADEINRTSGKTQSALLEALEEGQVSVDGNTYPLPKPFMVVATENEVGSIGTKELPFAEMDRFLFKFKIGYPEVYDELNILKSRQSKNPLDFVCAVSSLDEIIKMQEELDNILVKDNIYLYVLNLVNYTRSNELFKLGLSPRVSLHLIKSAKAYAYLNDRNFVIPEDVRRVFILCARHRLMLSVYAINNKLSVDDCLNKVLKEVACPDDDQ